jgi:non-heme chloroperoxidase
MPQAVPPPRLATARLASGLRVHYAEQGDPGGEPIVFLPAYTDSWFSYSRVVGLLSARSRVYPETGHSPHWERPERFAADLDAFMRQG